MSVARARSAAAERSSRPTISLGAAYNFRSHAAREAVRSPQHPRSVRRRAGVLGAGDVSRPQGVDAAQRVVSRRALAPPDRALLPLGVSSRRRRHRRLGGDARSRCGRYADFQSTIIPNGVDVGYWRARPELAVRAARDAQPRLSRPPRAAQRPRGRDRRVQPRSRQSMPDVRLLMAGDGPMRARAGGAGPAGAARPRRIHRRGLRPASGAARVVVGVPAAGAGGRLLDHGAGGLRGRSAGRGAARRSGPTAPAITGRT